MTSTKKTVARYALGFGLVLALLVDAMRWLTPELKKGRAAYAAHFDECLRHGGTTLVSTGEMNEPGDYACVAVIHYATPEGR